MTVFGPVVRCNDNTTQRKEKTNDFFMDFLINIPVKVDRVCKVTWNFPHRMSRLVFPSCWVQSTPFITNGSNTLPVCRSENVDKTRKIFLSIWINQTLTDVMTVCLYSVNLTYFFTPSSSLKRGTSYFCKIEDVVIRTVIKGGTSINSLHPPKKNWRN